ncbi:MAG: histidine kinase [Mycobacteriales bacterium]
MRAPSWTARGDSWFAGVAAAAAALVGVLGTVGADGARAGLEVAALSALSAAGFLVATRRRLPTALLAGWTFAPPITLALRERSEGTYFLLVIAVCFVALVEPDRRIRLAAGLVAVAVPGVVELAVRPDWGWPFWTGGILFGWLSAEQMRRFRALVAELTATRERLAEQAVQLERRRIAGDLHDLVGHSLGVLLLHVTGARRRLRDDPAAAEEALRQAEAIGRAGLAEVRRDVAALRDERGAGLAPVPTAADVPELVGRTAGPVELTVTGDLAGVEPVAGLAVYRVVQESLANAARHAPGAAVQVEVDVRPEAVEVVVRDAGGAGAAPDAGGVGLVGMRERVEALGGRLSAGPAGTGWAIRAAIPAGPDRTPAGPDRTPAEPDRTPAGPDRTPAEPRGPAGAADPAGGPDPRPAPAREGAG